MACPFAAPILICLVLGEGDEISSYCWDLRKHLNRIPTLLGVRLSSQTIRFVLCASVRGRQSEESTFGRDWAGTGQK
jgi:hypothetical protein